MRWDQPKPGNQISGRYLELGFFKVRVDPNLSWVDLRDDSKVDPRNSGQDSSYSRVK